MNSQPGVLEIPKRLSLSGQTASAIKKAVGEQVWQEFLPSERRLCDMFQVSRPTIRTALQQLAKEGLIEIRQGRRNARAEWRAWLDFAGRAWQDGARHNPQPGVL